MKDSKHQYQMVAVLNPKTDEKEKETILNKVSSWMEEAGAEVSKKDHMGNKELSYEINGFNKGDFWTLDIESLKALNLKNVNLFLNREVSIIRYLILKK